MRQAALLEGMRRDPERARNEDRRPDAPRRLGNRRVRLVRVHLVRLASSFGRRAVGQFVLGLPDCLQKAGLSVAVGSGKGSYLAVADADANFLVGITYDGSVANAQKAERYKTDNGGQYIAASIGPVDYFWDPNSISESQMSAVTGCLEHTYPNAPTS